MSLITLASLLFVFVLGALTAYFYTRHLRQVEQHKAKTAVPPVRDAGPEHMENPPKRWNDVDQQADESFPASDPPGNY